MFPCSRGTPTLYNFSDRSQNIGRKHSFERLFSLCHSPLSFPLVVYVYFFKANLGERVGKWTEEVVAGRKISDNPLQMICTHGLTPSLIDHVGTIRDGSTVCHDMAEGRTCDDIRDVLGLPRDPSGDNKRTTRTGTCQWTTLYCAEIALPRISLPPSSSCLFLPPYFRFFYLTGEGK